VTSRRLSGVYSIYQNSTQITVWRWMVKSFA
jgi:hypothetical protein